MRRGGRLWVRKKRVKEVRVEGERKVVSRGSKRNGQGKYLSPASNIGQKNIAKKVLRGYQRRTKWLGG